jgi:hypothetical protein
VHSVLFLVLDFLFVAALYVLLGAQFLAVDSGPRLRRRHRRACTCSVMLVNLKRRPRRIRIRIVGRKLGFALAAGVLIELVAIASYEPT